MSLSKCIALFIFLMGIMIGCFGGGVTLYAVLEYPTNMNDVSEGVNFVFLGLILVAAGLFCHALTKIDKLAR